MNSNNNQENNEKGNYIECVICLENAKLPVTTQCGHVFCWNCIKDWVRIKGKNECPICKSGVDLKTVIKIYSGDNTVKPGEIDDRPTNNREEPKKQKIGIVKNILNSFGFYGTSLRNVNTEINLPSEKEVLRNRISLVVLLLAFGIIYLIFQGD